MSMEVQLRRFNSMERRPKMLKDFLSENNPNSCSSNGFKSFPRRIPNDVVTLTNSTSSSKFSTFQSVINTIRNISFFTMTTKSPSMLSLPRSLSRKLSSRRRRSTQSCKGGSSEIKISTVKIKDIIRWKSFRDLQPSVQSPSDFHRYATECSTTTVTTTTTCSSSSSGGSSWSDGDFFTAWWKAQNDSVEAVKKVSFSPFVVGKDSVDPFVVGAKEDLTCQEDEQHSPVSVLQVGEDEFSPFDQSLANIERRKQKFQKTFQKLESLTKFDLASFDQCLLSLDENSYYEEEYENDDDDDEEEEEDEDDQKAKEQDWVKERAKQLLLCVQATSSSVQKCDDHFGAVLLDFFSEELARNGNQNRNDEGFEWEILRIAENWVNGSFAYDDILQVINKDGYIKDMDRRGGWSRFEEERENLAVEIEAAIFHSLVDDLLDLDA